jgi:hypothetical protein
MIKYTIETNVCSKCGNTLISKRHWFGPAEIRCGQCETVLRTGFDEWDKLPPDRKFLYAVGEILWPSWIGATGCNGIFVKLLVQVFLWTIAPMPLVFILAIFDPELQSPISILTILFLGPLVYPILLAIRLTRMIRESQAYTQQGVIPVWGKRAVSPQEERGVSARHQSSGYGWLLRLIALGLTYAWFQVFIILLHQTPIFPGVTPPLSNWLAFGALIVVHVVGAMVIADLMRCLGQTRKHARVIGVVTFIFAPFALPIAALFSKHRVTGLLNTVRTSNAALMRGRATSLEINASVDALTQLEQVRNPTSVGPLVQALGDRDPEIRRTVAGVLGEIGDKRAVAPLIKTLKDPDARTRAASATALGKIGDNSALAPLKAASEDQDENVQRAIKEALETIEKAVEGPVESRPPEGGLVVE